MIYKLIIQKTFVYFIYSRIRYLITRFIIERVYRSQTIHHKVSLNSVDEEICFFGYYNISPINSKEDIIYLKVAHEKPRGSLIEPAIISLKKNTGEITSIGQSKAWNWQQGCMLQWLPGTENLILFNDYDEIKDIYISKVINTNGDLIKTYDIPVSNISKCGQFALSLNYDRLAKMRPDYGYFNRKNIILPPDNDDGIWHLDMVSGKIKLILSLTQLQQLSYSHTMEGAQHKVNHIDINPIGNRFMFLHRWIGPKGRFTRLITANTDGSGIDILNGDNMSSHCCWINNKDILSFCDYKDQGYGYFMFRDKTSVVRFLSKRMPKTDGHPSVSPNKKYIITDTYPSYSRMSHLYLYDLKKNHLIKLGRFYQPLKFQGEIRVDLHPKWSPDSKSIYFESAHSGKRQLYRLLLNFDLKKDCKAKYLPPKLKNKQHNQQTKIQKFPVAGVNLNTINTFLHYGYIPDPEVQLPKSIQCWLKDDQSSSYYSNLSKSELIRAGYIALKKSFKEEIGNDFDKLHLIPLSGGLDSRTILANLLEHLDPSKIITTTYGIKGSIDFERAKIISQKAGVKWEGIDLSPGNWKWKTDLLIEAAKRSKRPTWIFDNVINHSIRLKYGNETIYWSGLMGDALSMIEPACDHTKTWEEAKNAFIEENCICKKYKLTAPWFSPDECLPKQPFTHFNKLDYYSQLDDFVRQQCLTQHIFSPIDYINRYPFLNPNWSTFILSIPRHYRRRQLLYRKILQTNWPNLFDIWNSPYRYSTKLEALIHGKGYAGIINGFKKTFPQWTSKIALKSPNYIDWNYALRYQDDFKNVVYSNIQDLKARKIIDWLDIDKLWNIHQNNRMNLATELMTLAALEIHFKAKTIKLMDE